ncbi:unnamed protein product, partial [Gulo gulo]
PRPPPPPVQGRHCGLGSRDQRREGKKEGRKEEKKGGRKRGEERRREKRREGKEEEFRGAEEETQGRKEGRRREDDTPAAASKGQSGDPCCLRRSSDGDGAPPRPQPPRAPALQARSAGAPQESCPDPSWSRRSNLTRSPPRTSRAPTGAPAATSECDCTRKDTSTTTRGPPPSTMAMPRRPCSKGRPQSPCTLRPCVENWARRPRARHRLPPRAQSWLQPRAATSTATRRSARATRLTPSSSPTGARAVRPPTPRLPPRPPRQ